MKKTIFIWCIVVLLIAMLSMPIYASGANSTETSVTDVPIGLPTQITEAHPKDIKISVGDGYLTFGPTAKSEFVLIDGENLSGNVVIPEKVNGNAVTLSGCSTYVTQFPEARYYPSFVYNPDMVSLTFPASLQKFEYISPYEKPFLGCDSLKEIIFSGDGPALLCDSDRDYYESGVEFLDAVVPHYLGGAENIERLVLPQKVKDFILPGFTSLKEIVLDSSNPYFTKSSDGIIYNKAKTKLVTAAENGAERTEVTLPGTVTEIEWGGLGICINLERIYGGKNVTKMRKDEFIGCKNLNPFEDTYGHWGEESAKWAFQNQVFSGTSPFRFSPEGKMTRGMMVSVLYRMEGSPDPGWGSPFPDVPAPMYYAKPIKWASANGIAVGYSESRFAPEEQISREQMASMLYRYAQRKKEPMDISARGGLTTFTDHRKISDYAEEAMAWAVGEGFLSGKGDGRLDPQGTATRAEVASMLQRFWGRQTSVDQ